MDAATRDELNALRRRAYAPDADIGDDVAALARLAELEELALPPAPVQVSVAAPVAASEPASEPAPDTVLETVPVPPPLAPRPPRRLRALTLIPLAAVGCIAVAAMVLPQPQPTPAPPKPGAQEATAPLHIPVMIRDATGTYVDLSWRPEAPEFPVDGEMTWAQPLGEYYGWSMWIGAAQSGRRDQRCLLLTGSSGTRARCVDEETSTKGELAMSLPAARIEPADRPPGMTDDQRLRFTWSGGGYVTVQVTTRVRQ